MENTTSLKLGCINGRPGQHALIIVNQSRVSQRIKKQQDNNQTSRDLKVRVVLARTVYIENVGVGFSDFDLIEKKNKELVKSGKDRATKYLVWYDGADAKSSRLNLTRQTFCRRKSSCSPKCNRTQALG